MELGGLREPTLCLLDRSDHDPSTLEEADVVVCIGPEIDDVEGARVAAEATGAVVGGTREVCEAGRLPRNRQIGLLGRPVAPRLLVTVGVPGEFEQLTGFVKAGVVAAINAGDGAAMLAAADVGLVGDWRELLPALL
jgi:electron transfer flavoprotein alpha subunit